jgi:hypothetical protein
MANGICGRYLLNVYCVQGLAISLVHLGYEEKIP